MGTSNSTRRSSRKPGAASGAGGSSRNQLSHQSEEILPTYRKPELQDFECVICKDLVYKPVVNACGHAFFCFWCAHESMGAGFQNSACPMCRSTFSHMPRVCELAHSYLTKVWPTEYAARAAEVEEEEKQRNMFSPEPIGLPQTAGKRRQVDALFRHGGGQLETPGALHAGVQAASAASEIVSGEEQGLADSTQAMSAGMGLDGPEGVERFTSGDCECLLCNKLLFQPVVLSCGHAYCFLCLEERFPVGRVVCAYCQKAHLEDEVTVCGQLQEVIQGAFPAETHQRIRQERARLGNRTGLLKRVAQHEEQPGEPKGFVHFGIECDACGVYPIVGERYQCQDCEEEIGFDLCGRCHAAREQPMLGSYLFQQKHLPSHRMHRVAPVPTFLHQVMDTHPELSVSTVINMVMSMVDERGDESVAQHRGPLAADDDVDLGETRLFDLPEAPQPTENLTAASGQVAAEAESLEPGLEAEGGSFEGEDTGATAGPLDLTSRLVRTVLALAEVEQAVGRAGPQEDGAPAQGEAFAFAGAAFGGDGQSHEEANSDRGDDVPAAQPREEGLSRPGAEWVWVDDSSQRAELEAGSHAGGQAELQSDGPEQVSRSEDEPGVAWGEVQPDGAQDGDLVAAMGDQGSGHEECAACEVEQQDGVAGGSNDALDQGESSRAALKIGGQQRDTDEEGRQPSLDEAGMVTDPCNQAAVGPWSDAGRGRGFTEEWCAAHDRQQRAGCEPGLRRSDSYHQLMMASA